MELGRTCVRPDHRADGVILALWRELTRFMRARGLDTMIGWASEPMRDGGPAAASLWTHLRETHLAPQGLRVRPWVPLPVERLDTTLKVQPPPLVEGYLRLGAWLLGAPAWDPVFQTANLPMLVNISAMPARYRRHFLAEGPAKT